MQSATVPVSTSLEAGDSVEDSTTNTRVGEEFDYTRLQFPADFNALVDRDVLIHCAALYVFVVVRGEVSPKPFAEAVADHTDSLDWMAISKDDIKWLTQPPPGFFVFIERLFLVADRLMDYGERLRVSTTLCVGSWLNDAGHMVPVLDLLRHFPLYEERAGLKSAEILQHQKMLANIPGDVDVHPAFEFDIVEDWPTIQLAVMDLKPFV